MNPDFIYFDLDNTLLNHSSAETNAQRVTYESYPELQRVTLDEWLNAYRVNNHMLWSRYQRNEIDRHHLQFSRFHDTMKELNMDTSVSSEIGSAYMTNYRNHWIWVEGAKEALERVSRKYKTGIITNGFKETQEKKFEIMELNRYCKTFLISEDVGKMKPHPAVFDKASDMAGVERNKILYVGDSYVSDIEGGSNAGWSTAWYTGFETDMSNGNRNRASVTFSDFATLTNLLDV
ncbi:HAD family hydrolase [Rhodohalobacter mucosus]|uniref:HAD family hydrolase n=2 Tax=Rhodohalobacter mucosus TaxID=2079485 RepID=A0A316TYX8_9BACT|nr:HAD family hydrolase [Rhodohalobacter mucosus]